MAIKKKGNKVGKSRKGKTAIHPAMHHLVGKTLRKRIRRKKG